MSSLQAMELFVGAVREGSFSAAGRRAGLSPASVARHVALLEARLGVQLLNRTSRSLALTEAGQEYYARLEQILQDIKEAEGAASALQSTPRGSLRIHSRMMFGMRVLTPLIPEFQARYPELKVELRLSERPAQLSEQEFDIDLRIGAPPDSQFKQRLLLRSERILVASPDYLAGRPAIAAPRDLLAHRCMTYWTGPEDVVWRFLKDGAVEELPMPSRFTTNNGEVLRQLAVAGHGIALLDDYTVQGDMRAGRLARVLPQWQATNTSFGAGIYAVFHQARLLPAKTRAFLDFLAEALPRVMAGPG
ncbi:LysR family transcriptional regulator [Pseudoroseomonas ludipueritiae]|uniref:LysR family transcriptional regulator n=1 Tax=Pseudoroseomonas ludipueritiae TaxID=198093 RepID=A0ABR7R710_9PROT|nr:LysR family transcriptional regulator [Pseudoroseomonas ludipueritiae]MBC9177420.1 LysR family transcriptional regulator [Pseudoroseomonas ludipueritiae]MCG7361496.1 LysR family transcriptional regulator [Roseomonas sp. ACRSG]